LKRLCRWLCFYISEKKLNFGGERASSFYLKQDKYTWTMSKMLKDLSELLEISRKIFKEYL